MWGRLYFDVGNALSVGEKRLPSMWEGLPLMWPRPLIIYVGEADGLLERFGLLPGTSFMSVPHSPPCLSSLSEWHILPKPRT